MARKRDAPQMLLVLLGASQLVLGAFMVLAPGTFFEEVGPYGNRNDHYLADLSTFYFALGVVLLVSVRRPSWRVPVLAFATLQYALHAINHVVDVGEADPGWLGPANLTSLALMAVVLGWLLILAWGREREAP